MSEPLITIAECDADGVLHLKMAKSQHQALCKARFAKTRVELVVRAERTKRSKRANDAFHAGLFEWAAYKGLAGEAARQWVEDAKDDLLALVFGFVVRQDQFSGAITRRLVEPHTADLSVEQFGSLFDVALVEAAKDGHLWRLPEEFQRRKAA